MRKLAGAAVLAALPFVASGCGEERYSFSDVRRMINQWQSRNVYFVEGGVAYRSWFNERGMLITLGSRIRDPHKNLSTARPNSPELAGYFYDLEDPDLEVWTNPDLGLLQHAYVPIVEDRYAERGREPEFGARITPEHRQAQMRLVQLSGRTASKWTFF